MEFTRLAEVEVVETAADDDKVLIEQNGEVKRVPKTEVGGSGNTFIINVEANHDTGEITFSETNMTFEECMNAMNNFELTGTVSNVKASGEGMSMAVSGPCVIMDCSVMAGVPMIYIKSFATDMELYWTADGISMNPPEGMG